MRLICWLVLAALAMAQDAKQPDPRALIQQSAEAIKQYKSYRLESTVAIDMHGGPINDTLEMPSSISVRRPDKMRIESTSKAGQVVIVADGRHTWFYISNVKKYVKRAAVASPEAAVISLWRHSGGLEEHHARALLARFSRSELLLLQFGDGGGSFSADQERRLEDLRRACANLLTEATPPAHAAAEDRPLRTASVESRN